MNKLRELVPAQFRFLFWTYLAAASFFFLFRLILVLLHWTSAREIPFSILAGALFMGFRFDTVITCYLLSLPFLFFSVSLFVGKKKWLFRSAFVLIILFFTLAFLICAADIPFFNHFLSRITISILTWSDTPGFMAKLVIQDPMNYPFIGLFVAASVLFYLVMKRIKRKVLTEETYFAQSVQTLRSVMRSGLLVILVGGAIVLGMRGRLARKSPIQWGTAFFSDYNFANQLGLNPVFTFMRSYIDSKNPENERLHFMDDKAAIELVTRKLGSEKKFDSPIAREMKFTGPPVRANVVIVIMESMGATNMAADGCTENLTPVLDSLSHESVYFSNAFTSGIHTFNGVYSTIYSYPSLMAKHTLLAPESNSTSFTGIASTLRNNGYETMFFCPHDDQFDNMGGFLKANGFEKIFGEKDYPSDQLVSTMGVPDHYLFGYSVMRMQETAASGKNFLAVILTGSNHGPYHIPGDTPFKPVAKTTEQQAVQYADWSIGKFLKDASREKWFANTLFVFVADHGSWYRSYYNMPLSYHHAPLIFYSPSLLGYPKVHDCVAGQVDIFPTVMGVLKMNYVNNTFGIDLLNEKRKCLCFSADDKLGCVDSSHFYVKMFTTGEEFLYCYRNKDEKNYIRENRVLADSLKNYAFAILQSAQWMIENKKTGMQK